KAQALGVSFLFHARQSGRFHLPISPRGPCVALRMLLRLVSPSGSASGQQPSGHAAATEPLRATHPSASADALSSPAWPAATHPPAGVQSLAGDWLPARPAKT